jgi:hypothetical protein
VELSDAAIVGAIAAKPRKAPILRVLRDSITTCCPTSYYVAGDEKD